LVFRFSSILKILAFAPPLLMLVGTIGTLSCGKSIFPTVTATNTSTSTSTASMAFVTNFNSGTISEFTRNATTGKLHRVGTIAAGSKKGPMGMAIPTDNTFLYAANNKDGKLEEYSIGAGAVLSSIGTVSDGVGSGPAMIAINPAQTFLWATNNTNGTISGWSIGSSGALTSVQTVSGLSGPLGIIVNSAGSILYVADNTAGLIYSYNINTTTGALSFGSVIQSLNGSSNGSPAQMTIGLAGGATPFLYVSDPTNGVVSAFNISGGSPSAAGIFPSTFSSTGPFGIGFASISSALYVVTANQGDNDTWAFQVQSSGALTLPPNAEGNVATATGLAIDPANAFAYTADQGDGTVGIFQLGVACPSSIQPLCQIGKVQTETNPPSGGSAPFDVVVTN